MKKICTILCITVLFFTAACQKGETNNINIDDDTVSSLSSLDPASSDEGAETREYIYTTDVSVDLKNSDLYFDYKTKSYSMITFDGDMVDYKSDAVTVAGGITTFNKAGVYVLKGNYNGAVRVEAPDTDKVYLFLDGVTIDSGAGPAIYAPSCEKLIILLPDNTVNSLSDSIKYSPSYDEKVTSVIYSQENLSIVGSGMLNINGRHKDGIVTKDNLKIIGSTINVTSEDDGIVGKDLIYLSDAKINIKSGDDGLKTSNDKDIEKGMTLVERTLLSIEAGNDAIKATNNIYLDDANLTVRATDDAIHSDRAITVKGGRISLDYCHEGIEAPVILFKQSDINIVSEDDAINAIKFDLSKAGGSFGHSENTDPATKVLMEGGNLTIETCGDGIDSNGNIEIKNGYIYVVGAGIGDIFVFDCADDFTFENGTIVGTNVTRMFQPTNDIKDYTMLKFELETPVVTDSSCELKTGSAVLESFNIPKDCEYVYVISGKLTSGQTYTLTAGNDSYDAKAE